MSPPKMKPKRRPVLCAGRPVSLVILAGGRSRRMGRSKASLRVPGGTILERILRQVEGCFDDIMISLSPGQRPPLVGNASQRPPEGRQTHEQKNRAFALRFIRDSAPGRGPMAGVAAGLRTARHDVCAVIACDIPDIRLGFLRRLARKAGDGYDAVVPVSAEGLAEPLFAVYRRAAAPKMEKLLASGRRSLLPLLEKVKTCRFPLGDPSWLKNLNTPDEYRAYLGTLSRSRRRPRA